MGAIGLGYWLQPPCSPQLMQLLRNGNQKVSSSGDIGRALVGYLPLSVLKSFSPDLPTEFWNSKGKQLIHHLYEGNSIITFDNLQCKYGLPSRELYTYLRNANILQKNCNSNYSNLYTNTLMGCRSAGEDVDNWVLTSVWWSCRLQGPFGHIYSSLQP